MSALTSAWAPHWLTRFQSVPSLERSILGSIFHGSYSFLTGLLNQYLTSTYCGHALPLRYLYYCYFWSDRFQLIWQPCYHLLVIFMYHASDAMSFQARRFRAHANSSATFCLRPNVFLSISLIFHPSLKRLTFDFLFANHVAQKMSSI